MKPTIQNIKDSYEISRSLFEQCELEAEEVRMLYTNRQFTDAQLSALGLRGQPAETFNVITLFSRSIMGFLDTVANDIQVKPRTLESESVAYLVNDGVRYITEYNSFLQVKKKAQLDGMLSGLMCIYSDAVDTGKRDNFGRPIYKIVIEHIPSWQIAIDPLSSKDDFSDARFIHRFKWLSEEEIDATYGTKKRKKLQEYYNYLDDNRSEFEKEYGTRFNGKYKVHDNYLITHSIIRDKNKVWSIHWCDEVELSRKEVTHKKVGFPYRVVKMNDSTDRQEYYGIFREVTESQKAINQALIQIQLLVNTSRAFVEEGAVEDDDTFKEEFNRINSVISVKYLAGIKVENVSQDVLQQYAIIDKAFSRIQQVLGVNDSFLGQAYASDSGRKVQIQQNSSAGMLQYVTSKVQYLIQKVGEDIVGLMQQYLTASQVLRVSDKVTGDRYIAINQPLINPNTGQPITEPLTDPADESIVYDEYGNIIVVPIDDPDTSIQFSEVDVIVESVNFNNAQEKNQMLIENIVNGAGGQFLMQTNPAGYATLLGLATKEYGAKYSSIIGDIFFNTAQMISQGQVDPTLAMLQGSGNNGSNNGMASNTGGGQLIKPNREGGTPQ